MMRNKFLIFINLLITNFIFAQLLELPKSILSPNSASLGKYGDMPMNLYTGRANIDIPLYSLNEGDIPLDISLSYDTGGVRVNDVPGWVGQNWTLNAGGIITRSIRGKTFDELKFQGSGADVGQKGYYYHYQRLNTNDWNSFQNLKNLADLGYSYSEEHPDTYRMDLVPDIFTFNFMGITGKFFLGEDGEWKVSSQKNLKVKISETDFVSALGMTYFGYYGSSSTYRGLVIGKIEITDDSGNKFVFGKTQNDIEFTIPGFDNQTTASIFPNAWYLSEVYDKYGNKIYSFEYERGNDQVSLYPYLKNETYKRDKCGTLYSAFDYGNIEGNQTMEITGDLIKPVFLKKINLIKSGNYIEFNSYNNNALKYKRNTEETLDRYFYTKVDFFTNIPGGTGVSAWDYFKKFYFYTAHLPVNNGDPKNELASENRYFITGTNSYWDTMDLLFDSWKWRYLSAIYIKNSTGNTLKTIEFNYTNTPNVRLKLNNVNVDGTYKYSFEYNNFESLPPFTSKSFDHFGYYNGKQFNTSGQPGFNYSDYYSYRETDINLVKYGSLTKIIYPTGGYTTFEYEPHSYSNYVLDDRSAITPELGVVGGLRIKKKIDYSDINNKIIYEYLYKNNLTDVNSNGILLSKNRYYINDWRGTTIQGCAFYQRAFNMGSIIPMSNFSGTQIEYPKVIERKIDGNGNNIGYTKYSYNNYTDYQDSYAGSIQYQFSIFDSHTDLGFKRGSLKLKEVFDKNDIKKYEEQYVYSHEPKKVRAYNYILFPTGYIGNVDGTHSPDGNVGMGGTAYEIFYSDFNLTSKVTKMWGENGQLLEQTETSNYITKDNFGDNFLRNKSTTNTDGKILKEEYKYTFDKTGIEPYTSLTNRREYSIVETNKTLNTEKISSTKVDYLSMPIYNNNGSSTTATQLFPQKYSEAKGNNALEEKLMVDKYDVDGNILLAHKTNGTYIYYFYAYNNRYPIMKIEGAQSSGTGYTFDYFASQLRTLVEAAKPNMSQIINKQVNIINYYPNHQITFYTYKPNFGVNSITSPNGMVEYYNYDSLGRLINITDQNGKVLKDYYYQIQN